MSAVMEVDPTPVRLCGKEIYYPHFNNCKCAVFIDQHTDILIQRATCVEPILDKLLSLKVINDEEYHDIQSEKTPHKQMRALLTGPMRSRGDQGKQILYNTLKDQQQLMMDDLGAA